MWNSIRPEHRTQLLVVLGVAGAYFVYFFATFLGPYLYSLWKLQQEREDTLRNVKKKNESSSDMIDDIDINVETSESNKQKAPPIRLTKPNYILPNADVAQPSATLTQRKPVNSVAASSSSAKSKPLSAPPASTLPMPISTYNSYEAAQRDYMLATQGSSQSRAPNAARATARAESVSVRAEQDAEYAASIAREETLAKVIIINSSIHDLLMESELVRMRLIGFNRLRSSGESVYTACWTASLPSHPCLQTASSLTSSS